MNIRFCIYFTFFQSVFEFFCIAKITPQPDKFVCTDISLHLNYHLLPKSDQCGRVAAGARIMGGRDAQLGQFPWMTIFLKKGSHNDTELYCAGSIINDKYIITAAHCISEKNKIEDVIVRLGEHDMSKPVDCEDGRCAEPLQEHGVEEFIKHKLYHPRIQRSFDIALVRVKGRILFNDFVQPICLPSACSLIEDHFVNVSVTTAGWGLNSDLPEMRLTDVLQVLPLNVVPIDMCKKEWPRQRVTLRRQMCAGGSTINEGGKDSCEGDSGGPLMYLNDREGFPVHFVLVGLVSEGQECDKTASFQPPGIYIRVGRFIYWILKHIRE